ncbi:MAG: serine/threonine-protein phosphatase [Bacteroidaceae bacterium]|nr:serine/threonine-protein phosphatase [Bacteroidaceae bacterium]
MKPIHLDISAICDKAGRPVNQDNFWLCPDLSTYTSTGKVSLEDRLVGIELPFQGSLFLVADGMGGQSAGEVASQIVVDTIKQKFADLSAVDLADSLSVKRFIKQVIVDADKEMKQYAASHPETQGMGSTIVLLWLLADRAYVGWCGDSRAYCYNEANRLVRLSHDHSYVQDLVDKGLLPEEHAFDHPNSNIITRSLGDSGEKANPEVKDYPIHHGDIFLLCSDGLCGLLRDEEIEDILSANTTSIGNCLKALWHRGTSLGWNDNTTIILAKVTEGGEEPTHAIGYDTKANNPIPPTSTMDEHISQTAPAIPSLPIRRRRTLWISVVAVVVALLCLLAGILIGRALYAPMLPAEDIAVDTIGISADTLYDLQPTTPQDKPKKTVTVKSLPTVKDSVSAKQEIQPTATPIKEPALTPIIEKGDTPTAVFSTDTIIL